MDGGHPGRAVAAGAGLDGDAGEALAGRGEAGGGPYLQLGLVVGGEQQEGGVAVEHVAGAFHGALEQAVEVVGGGGADEDLEGVDAAALAEGGRVGRGLAHGALEHRALVVAYQQADRGRLALGVADPQVRGVHGDDAAVGAPYPVGAFPARELEGLDDAGGGAGGVRPGGEVGERLAGDLLGGVAEELLARPRSRRGRRRRGRSGRPRRGLVPSVTGSSAVGRAGPAERVPTGRLGRSSWNQTFFLVAVYSTPQREARAAQSSRPRPFSRSGSGDVGGGAEQRNLTFGVAVGHFDAYAVLGAQAQDVRLGAGVDHRVGDELAGQDHGVVHDVRVAPALEGVTDEGAGGRDRPPDRVEAGCRPRGDHRTPRTRLDARISLPGLRNVPSGNQQSHVGPPLRCPVVVLRAALPQLSEQRVRTAPCRADRGGWTAGCQVTYLRCPSGCRSPVFPPSDGRGRICEAAELLWPGSAMVKHWACFRRQPGQCGQPLREGHGGVWRSGAGRKHARERRSVPDSTGPERKRGSDGTTEVDTAALQRLLAALAAMRDGNFRKRLTVSGDGVMAEIAAVFNEVADRNLHLTGEIARVRRMVGREGKLTERLENGRLRGLLGGRDRRLQRAGGRSRAAGLGGRAGAVGGRRGRSGTADGPAVARQRRRRAAAARGVPQGRADRQQPGRPALRLHRRGDAGGPRGRHRGQARRSGPGARYVRFLEGSDGFRQHDGVPADRAGT